MCLQTQIGGSCCSALHEEAGFPGAGCLRARSTVLHAGEHGEGRPQPVPPPASSWPLLYARRMADGQLNRARPWFRWLATTSVSARAVRAELQRRRAERRGRVEATIR